MVDTRELASRIRLQACEMTHQAGSSHIGAVFSMADIIAVLYGRVLAVKPDDPRWPERDRFVLSKGHAGAGVYAALAARGFFPEEWLQTYYQNGSRLSGHVSHKGVPGVEVSTGSLGHGLSIATGMAWAARHNGQGHRVFVVLGDGECDEGAVWEAALFAAHHHLGNLVAIIDHNKLQSLTTVEETLNLAPFAAKWQAFGWEAREVDGHDHQVLAKALDVQTADRQRPMVIIAHTIKGKGVSFMENSVLWHYRSPQGQEYEDAMRQLKGAGHAG